MIVCTGTGTIRVVSGFSVVVSRRRRIPHTGIIHTPQKSTQVDTPLPEVDFSRGGALEEFGILCRIFQTIYPYFETNLPPRRIRGFRLIRARAYK
jgi:hypothetical protein